MHIGNFFFFVVELFVMSFMQEGVYIDHTADARFSSL